MEVINLIEKSLHFNEEHLKLLVEDVSEEQMSICPAKGIENHPAWTIGHLCDASEMSCELLGDSNQMPEAWIEVFRRTGPGDSTIPPTDRKLYPSKEALLNKLIESHQRQIVLLKNAKPDLLQEKVDWSYSSMFSTKIELLHFMATWHEANHIAQITVWRRAMGLPPSLASLKGKPMNEIFDRGENAMKLTDEKIRDIAGELDCGLICFLHKKTKEVTSIPDFDQFGSDGDGAWDEDLEEIDDNPEQYIKIEPMMPKRSFRIMEAFASQVSDPAIKEKLFHALEKRKPFRNFRYVVDDLGDLREDWFKFKHKKYEDYVRSFVEMFDEDED